MATKVLLESETSSSAGYWWRPFTYLVSGVLGTVVAAVIAITTNWENMLKYYPRYGLNALYFGEGTDLDRFARPLFLPSAALLMMVSSANGVTLTQIIQWCPFSVALYLMTTLYCLPTLFGLSRVLLREILESHLQFMHYLPSQEQGNDHIQNDTIKKRTPERPGMTKSRTSSTERYYGFDKMGPPSSIYSNRDSDISLGTAELAKHEAACKSISSILDHSRRHSLIPDTDFHPGNPLEYHYGFPESPVGQDRSTIS
ncbi:hypothetical protein ACMFMF_010298 [Clarireedia jacksonii]